MRRILIESARRKRAIKRGEKAKREAAEVIDWLAATNWDQDLLLDIDEGLTRLSQEDDIAAALVKMRLFAGLSVTDAGRMLGMSRSAAYRAWDFARSWFAVNAVGLSDCPPESPTPA